MEDFDYFTYEDKGIKIDYMDNKYMEDLNSIANTLKNSSIDIPKWLEELVETYKEEQKEFNEER